MIVAHDCENKQLKGAFSLNCSSDTQSQLLSASAGIDVRCRIISNPKKKKKKKRGGCIYPVFLNMFGYVSHALLWFLCEFIIFHHSFGNE